MPQRTESESTSIGSAIKTLRELDSESMQTVLAAVISHLKISLPSATYQRLSQMPSQQPPEAAGSGTSDVLTDIRSFKEKKQPKSANEMAALVAFYLAELAPLAA